MKPPGTCTSGTALSYGNNSLEGESLCTSSTLTTFEPCTKKREGRRIAWEHFRSSSTTQKGRSTLPNSGILNAQGEEWRQIRTAVQPCTFRPRTVQLYAEAMGQIADDALELVATDRDENGDVPDCYAIMQRWALESVMFVSLERRLGLLDNSLPSNSDAAGIMKGILTIFADMDKLATRFPYYRYFPTPTIRSFQRAGDYLVPDHVAEDGNCVYFHVAHCASGAVLSNRK
ncbi:hypothetical protein MTO96_015638 [Rhipicephalus appendiculatus]